MKPSDELEPSFLPFIPPPKTLCITSSSPTRLSFTLIPVCWTVTKSSLLSTGRTGLRDEGWADDNEEEDGRGELLSEVEGGRGGVG